MKELLSKIFMVKMLIVLTILTGCGEGRDEIEDEIAPTITLHNESNITLNVGDIYNEAGADALDDMDGDISALIVINGEVVTTKPGLYKVTYSVQDSAGNSVSTTRTIRVVDTENPFILLKGKSTQILNIGDGYYEYGAEAHDKNDGDISKDIKISGKVNTHKLGIYTKTYSISDTAGNHAHITRDILVRAKAKTPSGDIMIIDSTRTDASIDLHDKVPEGAHYTYEKDDFVSENERVLSLQGDGLKNSFHLLGYETDIKYNWWSLPSHQNKHIVSWDSKFSEDFIIFVVLKFKTADGETKKSDLVYTPSQNGYENYTDNFMHISLGASAKDGHWYHFERNILDDLHEHYPGATIDYDDNIAGRVNGIAVRGSGRITNITLSAI